MRKMKTNRMLIFFAVTIAFLIVLQNVGLALAEGESDKYLANDETVKYSWSSKEAYIPYSGTDVYMKIIDMSNPDDILISTYREYEENGEDLTEYFSQSVSSNYMVLSNYSLINNWSNCPANIEDGSEIKNRWTGDYLSNTSELFNEVERDAVKLEYTLYGIELDGYDYNVTVKYLWDKKTGVLLEYSMDFVNTEDSTLSGYLEQSLSDTSLWSLDTGGGIPGFSTEIILGMMIIGGIFAVMKIKKNGRVIE